MLILFLIILPIVNSQSTFSWRDNFDYTSTNQFTTAGWTITQNPSGVSFSNNTIILDGTTGDTSVAYSNHFPDGITEWTVESKSKWLGAGHSQPVAALSTDKHGYSFAADGWYGYFCLYRDGVKTTFGTYNEQVDVWVNMTMVMQGNNLYMYYNGQLENVYTETDTSPQHAVSLSISGPWEGNEAYEYCQFNAGAYSSSPNNSPAPSGEVNTVWVPPTVNGAVTPIITVGAVASVAALTAAFTSVPQAGASGFFEKIAEKLRELFPESIKKWFEELVSSKRKLKVDEKQGSPYLPTKSELIVYAFSVVISTVSFAYVKVISLDQFLIILPTFFATSIIVSLLRTYVLTLYSRRKGVWTEYKLWYFGVGLFLVTTFALKSPFSSPTRTVHHGRNFTEKLGGFLAIASVLITLGFAGLFLILLQSGYVLVGGTGLAMCLISAFLETFPIEPMSGRDIFKYNKTVWAAMFFTTLALYGAWLMQSL